jgi:hypothetical protein
MCLLVGLMSSAAVMADGSLPQVQVAQPFIELHSGPAEGYPVFYVAEKGEWLSVLKRRTSWFKVETAKGQQGWVKQLDIELTLKPSGQALSIADGTFASYAERDFELGAMAGLLESIPAISVTAAWVATENIVTEVSFTQALGDFSASQLLMANLVFYPFPEWHWSPYVSLGGGQITTKPRANLVDSGAEQRTSDMLAVGLGLRYYLARNVVLKLEYHSLLAITDRDEQEELEQWKLGFAVFF